MKDKALQSQTVMFIGKEENLLFINQELRKISEQNGFSFKFRGNEGSWLGMPVIEIIEQEKSVDEEV